MDTSSPETTKSLSAPNEQKPLRSCWNKRVYDKFKTENFQKKPWRALAAYWLFGLCNNYGYVVMLSAANDILHSQEEDDGTKHINARNETDGNPERQCNYLSTGAVLLADILPSLTIKFIAPFLPFFVNLRIATCIILAAAGFVIVAFSEAQWMSIVGVIVTSLSSGLGEVTFLQYSSLYDKDVVSTWSSGTGGAGVIGALSYAGLHQLGIRNALLIMLIVPLTMAIAFWFILTKPTHGLETISAPNDTDDVSNKLTTKEKISLLPQLLKYMLPLGFVYFFEYFINQGLFELVNFEGIFIDKDEQYRWLQVDYQIGVFISRSSVNIIHIKKIWLLAVLQLINVFFFTTEVIFYYIPSFWIVLALTLWEGFLGGGAYVNTFYKISTEVSEKTKLFSMGTVSFADSLGITLAGIFAILAHNSICDLSKPERLSI